LSAFFTRKLLSTTLQHVIPPIKQCAAKCHNTPWVSLGSFLFTHFQSQGSPNTICKEQSRTRQVFLKALQFFLVIVILFNTPHTAVTAPEVYDRPDQAATSQPQFSSRTFLTSDQTYCWPQSKFSYFITLSQLHIQEIESDFKCVGPGPAQLVWYMGYGLDNQGTGVQFLAGSRDFFFSTASRPAPGPTRPSIQWILRALPQEVKQLDWYYTPPNANVKNARSYNCIPHTPSWCGAKLSTQIFYLWKVLSSGMLGFAVW
jgi:hypothetical protein